MAMAHRTSRAPPSLLRLLVCSVLLSAVLLWSDNCVQASEQPLPSESECRPYIEKALKDLEHGDVHSESGESGEKQASDEAPTANASNESDDDGSSEQPVEISEEPYVNEVSFEAAEAQEADSAEQNDEPQDGQTSAEEAGDDSKEEEGEKAGDDSGEQSAEDDKTETAEDDQSSQQTEDGSDEAVKEDGDSKESAEGEAGDDSTESSEEAKAGESKEDAEESKEGAEESKEDGDSKEAADDSKEDADDSKEDGAEVVEDKDDSGEQKDDSQADDSGEQKDDAGDSAEQKDDDSDEKGDDSSSAEAVDEPEVVSRVRRDLGSKEDADSKEADDDSKEVADDDSKETDEGAQGDADSSVEDAKAEETEGDSQEGAEKSDDSKEDAAPAKDDEESQEGKAADSGESDEAAEGGEGEESSEASQETPEEDLLLEFDIPDNLRSRDHIAQYLRLDEESTEAELLLEKSSDIILRQLKGLYDNAIKPLEILYKYRDLSNRHFGDPEIFSKPLILFMGPWSGGKSSLINYLTDNEFNEWSLRTGAEPSPAYFNILMHGKEPEVLDGTQLAADWTFSGLQKFGQGLEERLRGLKLPNKLLEKVNIVEIPGILEVRKQVSRIFPFNDACQWFIDRADIIFLVYDPSKLDVGPETEAILDQLKGRESQTRILLNKGDRVKPEELMRVQSALIWNISPLMSSAQPPVMYTTSLWSMPYEQGSPVRLLQSQEKQFLLDLRNAIDKRVENKIASARRFAVRVRNHAKMVDCYLTTYYNHKTIFGNKKLVAEAIIEHPQNYHIYEGLSTLTNISRYDLPDPETYRDFFRLNPLYEFQQLSATCTYFRGCPINRLDVAIAYDLPELVGKYKKMVETATPQGMPKS